MYDGAVMASGPRSAKPTKGATVERLMIEQADNGGFTVRRHFRPKPGPRKGPGGEYVEPETLVYGTIDEVVTCLKDAFPASKAAKR